MNKWIILVILAISAQLLPAKELELTGWLTDALSAVPATYPDADVVVIDDINRIEYDAEGTDRYQSEAYVKILTEKGRQEKSSISLEYDAAYGSLKFLKAEIIKSDSTTVPIDLKKQTGETISSGQMNANIYDPNSKTLMLSVPDLEIGDVLHYSFAGNRTKTLVPNSWSDWLTLEDSDPIIHAVYEVDAPASRPLTRKVLRDEIKGTVQATKKQIGDRILYRWEVRNVPRMFEEPGMPAPFTVVQRVLLSTLSDWKSLSKWYWELSKPRLETVTPEMASKVKELTKGLTDRQKQIEAIFRFVSQDIRYMGITLEDEAPGYEPHDVSLTFNNRYGVCRDKAALLVAMLRLGGFDAYPVLIYVGPKKDPDVPQPWFNHAITAVRNADGSYQLMDSTNENTRDLLPAYLSDCSYLVAHPDGETLQTSPVTPPEDNLLSILIHAALESDNRITGEASLSFAGINDTAYRGRLARLKPDERKPYFEGRLKQALGNATLTRLEIQPAEVRDTSVPLSVTLRFELENAMVSSEEQSLLKVPTLINRFGLFGALLGDGIGLNERRYPLKTSITCGVSETVRLDLRKSTLRPSVLPLYKTVDTPELLIKRSIENNDGLLTSRADLMLRTVEFSPSQYLDLKKGLKTAEHNARKCVVLTPRGYPTAADIATLDETTEYSVHDQHNWKKTHTIRQKVLTYAGKNRLSDLKIPYNSAIELVKLNKATITAPDGTVQTIDPENEVHLMDAQWTRDAPRYPAEKILVANLPGVEIGSIIETTTTTLYRDRPLFSAMEYFSGENPITQKTVRLRIPENVNINIANSASAGTIRRRISNENGTIVYEWQAENQKMIKTEDQMPPQWQLKPTLLLSTGDIDDYAKTIKKALLKAAEQNELVSAQAKELTRGKNRLEKMVVLRNFVDRAIRAAGPGLSSLPLSAITPADQTFSEGYGNTTDRAVLLYALCKAAKLAPRFVLASDLPRVKDMAQPTMATFQPNEFSILLVAVNDGKTIYYLGDSGQYAQLGTLAHDQRPSINLNNGKPEVLKSTLPNASEVGYTMDLADNGNVDIVLRKTFYGTEFEEFNKKFSQLTPEKRRRETENLLSQISQSAKASGELRTSLAYPGILELGARAEGYAIRQGQYLYLTLPMGLGDLLNIKTSERENDFYIENPIRKTCAYSIAIPRGWQPVLIPDAFRTELPNEAGTVSVEIGTRENKLILLQRAELNPALINTMQYDQLVELNNRLTEPAARTLLLRKK